MVILNSSSNVHSIQFPFSASWDQNIRNYFNAYQKYIDQHTYHLQRTQRYFLSLPFPKYYAADIIRLKLLKNKQDLGKIYNQQIKSYQSINPQIRTHYNRTFGIPLINFGTITSFFAFGFTLYFNYSMIHRLVALALPVGLNYFSNTSNARSDMVTVQFLQWLTQVRKATSFIELHRDSVIPKISQLKDKNLGILMRDYIELAQGSN